MSVRVNFSKSILREHIKLRFRSGCETSRGIFVRVVYLDEGGISKPSDPHIVVAGIMVDADRPSVWSDLVP